MRKLIAILPVLLCFAANATTYYVAASGSDAATGTSTGTAWQTLTKVNATTLVAGDSVLFKSGDSFSGQLIIKNNGTSINPIVYNSYGAGAQPIITGLTAVNGWINQGGNIWQSLTVSTLPYTNMVVINGVNTPMGRYPNSGWLTYQSHTGNGKITTSSLTGSPNWTGAEAATKKNRFIIQRNPITAQSGGTITFGGDTTSYPPTNGFGFFIQNDTRTLDSLNEWYYNPGTNKLNIYNASSPTGVQIASVDTLVKITSNYVTVSNLNLIGANSYIAHLNNATGVNISNCSFSFGGINAVRGNNSPSPTIKNNTFTNINNAAITLDGANSLILNNTINKTTLSPGFLGIESTSAITAGGLNSSVKFNNIDSSGYCGVFFNSVSKVDSNFINHSCLTIDDGAGIYTSLNFPKGREIIGNTVLNSSGNISGTGQADYLAFGIYMDAYSDSITVSGNTISGCKAAGIYSSNNNDITIRNNTCYNNATTTSFNQGEIMMQYDGFNPVRRINIKNNLFIANTAGKLALFFYDNLDSNDVKLFGVADSNYYARPIDDNQVFTIQTDGTNPYPGTSYNLAQWQRFTGGDAHSNKSFKTITTTSDLRFEYNATASPAIIGLDQKYVDVAGNNFNTGSITLAPYTSAVLMKNGAIIPSVNNSFGLYGNVKFK